MPIRARLRDHVPAATALLTVVSLALVFGAVLGAIPKRLLPDAGAAVIHAIPDVNAVISVVAIGTILAGWRAVRAGEIQTHRRLMLTSFGLFATFLALYLYKVVMAGTTEFPGPAFVDTWVYLPTLIVHMLLAIVCIPLLYYVALLGLTRPVSEIPRTRHKRVGRVAATLWLVSFALGVVVYVLLYQLY